MKSKYVATVGSIDEGRHYYLELRDSPGAKRAAELLGAELAKQEFGIIVYSAGFVECDIVRGYVNSGKAREKSIRVIYPSDQEGAKGFPEFEKHRRLFDPRIDQSPEWEISYYRSLKTADGILLLGGGQSTLITGVLAMSQRIPLLSLRAYGGSAQKIWELMGGNNSLASQEQVRDMGIEVDASSAPRLIQYIEDQYKTRLKEEKQATKSSGIGLSFALLFAWIICFPLGYWVLPETELDAGWKEIVYVALMFLAPVLAGGSGATARILLNKNTIHSTHTVVLGMIAGAASSVLYVAGHFMAKMALEHSFPIFVIAVITGLVAGFTFDTVFRNLKKVNPLKSDVIDK